MPRFMLPAIVFKCGLLVSIFMGLTWTQAEEQDSFYFDPSPMDEEVIEGRELILRCDVSNRRMISFYWTLNGKPLVSTARRFQEDSHLRILKVDRHLDGGSFRCVATNVSTGMALRSTEARLNISWIDSRAEVQSKAVREGFVVNASEGSEVTMKCHAEGNPEPVTEWFHNKIRMVPSERTKMHKNRLRMISVTQQDTGVYTCRARNPAGIRDSSNSFVLAVHGTSDDLRLNTDTFLPHLLVKEGTTAHLYCQYFNSISTEWYFNDTKLDGRSGKYHLAEDGDLEIRHVTAGDAGSYRCVGRSGLHHHQQQQFHTSEVVLAYIDDLGEESFEPSRMASPVVIPAGGKLEILCHPPRALPLPSLRWIKRAEAIKEERRQHDDNKDDDDDDDDDDVTGGLSSNDKIKTTDGLLSLSNVDESMTGSYLCVVENLAGVKNKSLHVVVSVPPTIQRPPMSVRVTEEDSASFECKVVGTPHPVTKIHWLFDDEPIDMTTKDGEYDEATGLLKLHRVTLNDVGNYACVANTSGHQPVISTNAHLYVENWKWKRPEGWSAGQDGKSQPKIRWVRVPSSGVQNVQPSPPAGDRIWERDGVLNFRRVEKSDAGNYTCIAESDQGTINATISVDVYVKPRFKVRPNNMTLMEGQKQVMIHCVATGDPQPVVLWDKNGFNLQVKESSPRFKVLQNGTMVISEMYMEDNGKYGCTAENIGGLERTEIHLHVTTVENYHKLIASDKTAPATEGGYNMMRTVVIAVSCGLAYLALVIGLTVYCTIKITRAKHLKKHANPNEATDVQTENALAENAGLVPKKELEVSSSVSTSSYNTRINVEDYNTLRAAPSHINLLSPLLHQSILPHRSHERLYLPRHKLQMLGMLGRSHYGDVFLARIDLAGNGGGGGGVGGVGGGGGLVIVKSSLSKSDLNVDQCLREIDLLGRCNHQNVAKLVGLCADLDPLFVVVEHFEWGDLKKFLVASRDGLVPRLSHSQLVVICGQVALGMEHVAGLNAVHRDLAARNVIINPNSMEVKVSCPFLCRDVYAQDYFLLRDRLLPVRWMAPEAILDGAETKESDVWSYGVFVWEVFSLGETPLSFKTNEQVLEGLNSRENKLPHPSLHPVSTGRLEPAISYMDCPENMWRIIQACTMENPRSRPRFSDLVSSIYDLTYETVLVKSDSFVIGS